jgi:hypothetical protein
VAIEEAYSLAAELLGARSGKRRYLLRVVGQSMVGVRIEDGISSAPRRTRSRRTGR